MVAAMYLFRIQKAELMRPNANSPSCIREHDADGYRVPSLDSVKDLSSHYSTSLDFLSKLRSDVGKQACAFPVFSKGFAANVNHLFSVSSLLTSHISYQLWNPLQQFLIHTRKNHCIQKVRNKFTRKLLSFSGAFA